MKDAPQLGLDMFQWWDKKFAQLNSTLPLAARKVMDLTRDGSKIKFKFPGMEYILGFEDVPKKFEGATGLSFVAHTANPTVIIYHPAIKTHIREAMDYVLSGTEERVPVYCSGLPVLSRSEARHFKELFREAEIKTDSETTYDGKSYYGLGLRVPVRKIPLGKQEKLSENLFVYAQKGILAPMHAVLEHFGGR